jgi:hypothetical protein
LEVGGWRLEVGLGVIGSKLLGIVFGGDAGFEEEGEYCYVYFAYEGFIAKGAVMQPVFI